MLLRNMNCIKQCILAIKDNIKISHKKAIQYHKARQMQNFY